MLNQTGITTVAGTSRNQILANVEMQASVGCVVAAAAGTEDPKTKRKIAKAGTPVKVDLLNLSTAATKAESAANAVLLHDVDVTDGNANGTALIFGFVNLNRVDDDVKSLLETVAADETSSKLLVFTKQ